MVLRIYTIFYQLCIIFAIIGFNIFSHYGGRE